MKRILSAFLVFVMLTTLAPIGVFAASVSGTGESTNQAVLGRIKDLASKLGVNAGNLNPGAGTYFTTNQSPAKAGDPRANNYNVIKEKWFKDAFGFTLSTTDLFQGIFDSDGDRWYKSGGSCYGFAVFAQWYLFADSVNESISSHLVVATNGNNGDRNGIVDKNAKFNVETVAKYAKPGDAIMIKGPDSYHTVIYISHNATQSSIRVLDCNWDTNCQVQIHDILSSYTRWYNKPIAITSAYNYNDVSSSETESAITVNEQWIVDRGSNNLRIRSGPSTSYGQVGLVMYTDTVTVTKIQNNWGYVTYNGVSGWICLDYATKLSTECAHTYNGGVVTKEATTSSAGEKTYTCTKCGATKTEIIPKLAGATKTQYRYYHYTGVDSSGVTRYSVCGHYAKNIYGWSNVRREETGWLDAPLKLVSKTTSSYRHANLGTTCTNAGCVDPSWEGGKYEDANGVSWYREETRTVSAECAHTYNGGVVTTAATCINAGTKTYTCTKCGAAYSESVAALGHTYATTVTAPTCTAEGYTTHTCTACGVTYSESVSALGHAYATTVTAPTCTAEGYTTHTCTACGDSYTDSRTAMTEHAFGAWTVTVQPQIGVAGEETRVCGACGKAETRTLDAAACTHSYRAQITKEANCTEEGLTTYTCEICKESYTEPIAAHGHTYNGGVVTKEATTSSTGEKTYTCTKCGATKTETIPKLTGETETQYRYYHYVGVDSSGATRYSVCAHYAKNIYGCSNVRREETDWLDAPLKLVSKTTSSYVHTNLGLMCTNAGCIDPSWEGGKYEDANGVSWFREETRTVSAECAHIYNGGVCIRCGAQDLNASETPETPETPEAHTHCYDSGRMDVRPTCNTKGKLAYTCLVCGDVYEVVIPEKHNYYNNRCTICGIYVGKPVNSVLSTDIRAYVDGCEIPSYNVNGYTCIVAEDLRNYGFDVVWNGADRTLTVQISDAAITPLQVPAKSGTIGRKVANVLHTDIVTYVNGVPVESFNINGQTIIYFSALDVYGARVYDNASRTTQLSVK